MVSVSDVNKIIVKGSNGKSQIAAYVYPAVEKPKGIVYFAHGVTEYALRHDEFFQSLSKAGYIVFANDHMGHGASTSRAPAYFEGVDDKSGWDCAVEDAFKIISVAKERYPGLPIHGVGFSLGSFLIRSLALKYHYMFKSVVLIGTGYQGRFMTQIGKAVAKAECDRYGCAVYTEQTDKLTFGKYNKRFGNSSRAAWLCADESARTQFENDDKCAKGFSSGLFYELLVAMEKTCDHQAVSMLNKRCPVLLVSGADDAVGDFGKGVNRLESLYCKNGIAVQKVIYPGVRHDILHDTNHTQVYQDIIDFLKKC